MIKFLSKKLFKTISLVALTGLTANMDAQTLNWSPAGPIYTAGRARNMIVDKNDASGNTLYVGSTTSGIFKSTDGGVNWAPLNDQGTVRNISYMAQASNGEIFVGTGEGFLRPSQAAKAQPGTGLYKLVGNNLVLVSAAANTGTVINRIACHPSDPLKLAIATNSGVLISTDGGTVFTAANTGTFVQTTSGFLGQDVKFNGNGILYFSVGPVAGTSTVSSTVWKSDDATLSTFSNITPSSSQLASSVFGRIELAVAPSNPNVIYASCSKKFTTRNSANLQGLFVTYDGGTNWGLILVGSSQLDPLSNGGTISSGDYAHVIKVSPLNSNEIYLGSYQLYKFVRTGGSNSSPFGTWTKIGYHFLLNTQLYLHENVHDAQFVTSGSSISRYYIITDAGIYRSVDGLTTLQPFYKGLVTGQFNSVSIDRFPGTNVPPTSATNTSLTPYQAYIGGTGGNGLTYFNGNYPLVSQELSYESGDIFNAEYSKILPKAAYFSASSGSVFRTTDVTTGNYDLANFVQNTKSQTVQDLTNSTYTIAGTPFKLWENYGNVVKSPDSLIFYNDTAISRSTITSLTATAQFSFSIGRPQATALIDSIIIRTTTVVIAATPSQVAVGGYSVVNTKTLSIKLSNSYTAASTGTTSAPISSILGYTNGTPMTSNSVILNSTNQLDQIFITLATPLFTSTPTSAPSVANVADYLRVQATVYYRYNPNSVIQLIDNSMSTISNTLTTLSPADTLSWNRTSIVTVGTTTYTAVNPVIKLKQAVSARIAIPYSSGSGGSYVHSIRVSNAPLDMNTPLSFVTVSQDKCLTTDANGAPTSNTINIQGKPTLIEWGKSGANLYYATDANKLYRVSYLYTLVDSTAKGYSGKKHTNVFTYSNTPAPPQYTATAFFTPNPRSPYRTTLLGSFSNKITSISIPQNDSLGMVLTFDDSSPTGTLVMTSTGDIRKNDFSNIGWVNKTTSAMSNLKTYCSLIELNDNNKVFVGTDNGMFYTSDISQATPTWSNVNNSQLPNVQIFDIKQQTLEPWNCYNSGQIYVATNGRGIWTNSSFFTPYVVAVNEIESKATFENNLALFPNPTNGTVNMLFTGIQGESAKVSLIDINGRVVQTEVLGKLNAGEINYRFETSNLATGMYIVNVTSDSGIKRVTKLIVTK